jgi:hypothetical protein
LRAEALCPVDLPGLFLVFEKAQMKLRVSVQADFISFDSV